ncbi:MAG: hypothetical protein AAGC57_04925 [Pseudomonadota bacterium]
MTELDLGQAVAHSPAPGMPQTNHKAWSAGLTGSLTTLAMFYLSRLTEMVPAPELAEAQHAAVALLSALVGLVTGAAAHYTRNQGKED